MTVHSIRLTERYSGLHSALQGKRLIAFDLDGTLIDSVPDLAAAVAHALKALDLRQPSEAEVRDWVGNGAPVLVEKALTWALQTPPTPALQQRGYDTFMDYYGAAPHVLTTLYSGVQQALQGLHQQGMTLVLITNKPERFIEPLLQHFELLDYFTLWVGGDSLAEKKPHPLPLLHAARTCQIPAAECVMVGDSRHDIAAGKAAGFTTVALPYGYNHGEPIEESHPDLVLSSLTELLATTSQTTKAIE
ncbi:phosphoglycolate phosphatase [Halomonas sp. HAL1]|uniref:phosphoglycolate phosphatase n=1 Tax=Halomonas sp. HAL1 TaxID=550984 RepID=UPI00022D2ED1|nr:phosphoglycolate phosphatase [Halomonas sp. HAL1]EHA14034.1 phosphoglycolate phosphatase [Halomonas sp. HAL1]WKV91720.1 phosphoglycolate phosphatase [Halomonas sp. HAL1]|tara:strand:- start:1331 stop:2071 length:741 start_codon:yes stop_codon:yes gene_type:complete